MNEYYHQDDNVKFKQGDGVVVTFEYTTKSLIGTIVGTLCDNFWIVQFEDTLKKLLKKDIDNYQYTTTTVLQSEILKNGSVKINKKSVIVINGKIIGMQG